MGNEMKNSPPPMNESKTTTASEPAFAKGVAKVRVTPSGTAHTYDFKGKTFAKDGQVFNTSALGFTKGEIEQLDKDPNVAVERYDENMQLVKRDGSPYATIKSTQPKAAARTEIADTKADQD